MGHDARGIIGYNSEVWRTDEEGDGGWMGLLVFFSVFVGHLVLSMVCHG